MRMRASLAGSNDVLAKYLQVEVDTLNTVLKVLVFVESVLVGALTWWICRDLRDRGAEPIAHPPRIDFRRYVRGGFDEGHDGAARADAATLASDGEEP